MEREHVRPTYLRAAEETSPRPSGVGRRRGLLGRAEWDDEECRITNRHRRRLHTDFGRENGYQEGMIRRKRQPEPLPPAGESAFSTVNKSLSRHDVQRPAVHPLRWPGTPSSNWQADNSLAPSWPDSTGTPAFSRSSPDSFKWGCIVSIPRSATTAPKKKSKKRSENFAPRFRDPQRATHNPLAANLRALAVRAAHMDIMGCRTAPARRARLQARGTGCRCITGLCRGMEKWSIAGRIRWCAPCHTRRTRRVCRASYPPDSWTHARACGMQAACFQGRRATNGTKRAQHSSLHCFHISIA